MTRPNREILKNVLERVPSGFLVDSKWFAEHGVDKKLAYWYIKKNWFEPVTRGVYRRPFISTENSEVKTGWKVPILSMQRLMNYKIHVGGWSALWVHGYAHYVSYSDNEVVYVYGKPPSWIKRLKVGQYKLRSTVLFGDDQLGIENTEISRIDERDDKCFISPWLWPLTVSAPERAILELLNELPDNESFHIVDTVFESLTNLRPSLLEELLNKCTSIKVKRLFFVFADRHQHAWLKHINIKNVNLGSGSRALVKQGRFHPKYNISVPQEYVEIEGLEDNDGP